MVLAPQNALASICCLCIVLVNLEIFRHVTFWKWFMLWNCRKEPCQSGCPVRISVLKRKAHVVTLSLGASIFATRPHVTPLRDSQLRLVLTFCPASTYQIRSYESLWQWQINVTTVIQVINLKVWWALSKGSVFNLTNVENRIATKA